MRVVINRKHGGFGLSNDALQLLSHDEYWYGQYEESAKGGKRPLHRDDKELINLIEDKGTDFVSGPWAKLCIIEIPNEITDWILEQDAGYESIFYVLDGKIHIV